MALWEVDVAGVSRRFVDAPTKESALELVAKDLLAGMTLSARLAPAELDQQYQAKRSLQQKRMIAGLDSLSSRRTPEQLESEIARLQDQLDRKRAWTRSQLDGVPPADPARVARILEMIEVDHVRANLQRLERRDARPNLDHF